MHLSAIALLITLVSAQTGSFCSTVSQQSCKTQGTAFCSSYLKVPAKTTTVTSTRTITATASSTVTNSVTTRVTQGTVTQPTVASTTVLTTSTITTTAYSRTVITTSTDPFSTSTSWKFTGGCTVSTAPAGPLRKRQATLSKPPCLSAYASGTALSSACKCLSIPTSTATITSTGTRSTTVTATATVQRTFTTTVQGTTVITVSTFTSTSTRFTTTTTTQTGTLTSTTVVAASTITPTSFTLNGAQGDSNYNSGILKVFNATTGYQGVAFNQDASPDVFTLAPAGASGPNCVLTTLSGEDNGKQGLISKILSGDVVRFATPGSFAAGNVLICQVQTTNGQLFCRNPTSKNYVRGHFDANSFWTVPEVNSGSPFDHMEATPISNNDD